MNFSPQLRADARDTGCEAVLDGEYDVEGLELRTQPHILDIGANVGAFACWAMQRWPDARITCYEPHPVTFERLIRNLTRHFPESDAWGVGLNAAVTTLPAPARLYEGVHNRGGCSLENVGEQDFGRWVDVATIHPSKLDPCDVLKIDTEGCEVEILEHYTHLRGCTYVALEAHGREDREEIGRLLRGEGFALHSETPLRGAEDRRWTQRWLRRSA
jgi:FkbM family methyltransferase